MSVSESYPASLNGEAFFASCKKISRLLALSIRAHWLFFLLVFSYFLMTCAIVFYYQEEQNFTSALFSLRFLASSLPIFLLLIVIVRFIHIALHVKPEHPLMALATEVKLFLFSPRRLANGIPLFFLLSIFAPCFSTLKEHIPIINPFSWDVAFMELDKMLHFGVHPWELLDPILGYPFITFVVNINYNVWFIIMWGLWMWHAFTDNWTLTRTQFMLSFLLGWSLCGNLLAVLFSSAGPAFYSNLGLAPNPYEPLMAYLYGANEHFVIWALGVQETLWQSYYENGGKISGISAMPSLHNVTATIFAFVGWRINRILGVIMTIFAFLIVIGSVHLGWHYAVDSYFGVLLGALVWWVSGVIARWYHGTKWVKQYDELLKEYDK